MEKPKRHPNKRPYIFYGLAFTLIFVLGFGLGLIVLNILRPAQNPVNQVLITEPENSRACAPSPRFYAEPVTIYNMDDSQAQAASGGMVLGTNAPVPTSVAMLSISTTATQLSQVYAVTASPNSSSNIIMTPSPYIAPTMNGPATYTPMPTISATQSSQTIVGTSYPQGGNTSTVNTTVQIDTELRNPLNAGEIDDNAEWDVYLTYRNNFHASAAYASPVDDVDVSARQLIRVVDAEGQAILGARIEIFTPDAVLIQRSCSYATGYSLFFPNIYQEAAEYDNFRVTASKGESRVEAEMQLSDEVFTLVLDVEQDNPKLDLLFLIDASGSMDDEIAQLTNNILYISEQIDALPDEVDVRYALVSYKDGNYPTQVWDFTADVSLFQQQLASLYTAGGDGETLNDGLDRSLHAVNWRGDDTVKLIFLVGDEPPAVYPNHPSYAVSMLQASAYGIKVHPIASSGLDVQGEYIFRQIAQTTMGNFIFLSYGDGTTAIAESTESVTGSAGDESFGEYNVEQLDEIVLKLIQEEIAATGALGD